MKSFLQLPTITVLVLGLLVPAAASGRAAAARELPVATSLIGTYAPNQVEPSRLGAGGTFRARLFPIPVRFTTPNAAWSGAQGRTLSKGIVSTERGPYGWLQLATSGGTVSIITAYGRTASVATIVNGLRTRGRGATYEPTVPARVGSFAGQQFDGQVSGELHIFVPFTPKSGAARYVSDAYELTRGDSFRIVVLNVRSKSVVLLIRGEGLSIDQLPAFLEGIDPLLTSLRFPVR